jgi:hypothetical protein
MPRARLQVLYEHMLAARSEVNRGTAQSVQRFYWRLNRLIWAGAEDSLQVWVAIKQIQESEDRT